MSDPWSHLREALGTCLDQGSTFAAFRVPGQAVQLMAQRDPALKCVSPTALDGMEHVFLIAPFDHTRETLSVLRPDVRLTFDRGAVPNDLTPLQDCIGQKRQRAAVDGTMDQDAHARMVNEALCSIENGSLRKVVLSRTKDIALHGTGAADLFARALTDLPTAFICLVHTPDHGTWLGASPERLLCATGDVVEVDSIAGTMRTADAPSEPTGWGAKERDEQTVVTDQVHRVLSHGGEQPVYVLGPSVLQAGNVSHLHTMLTTSWGGRSLAQLLLDLHPTPAVCGTPSNTALAFIREHEPHGRGLYAGAWGPWRWENRTELFVNIRCMEVFDAQVRLFVGGGITAGSEASREWQETEHKAATWERIIQP